MTELLEAAPNGRHAPASPSEPGPESGGSRERPVAFFPPQLAVGAAVIAALILLGFRQLRRRRR